MAERETRRLEGEQATEQLVDALTMIGHLVPDQDRLREFLRACDREESIGPIFHPSAWTQAQKRLPALRKLADAALEYRIAWEALRDAAAEESDPDMDQAAREMYRAEVRRMREGVDRG